MTGLTFFIFKLIKNKYYKGCVDSLTQYSNGSRLEHQAFLSISGLHNHTVRRWIQFMINTITFTECHGSTQPVSALNNTKIQLTLKTYEGNATGVMVTIFKPLNRLQVQIIRCINGASWSHENTIQSVLIMHSVITIDIRGRKQTERHAQLVFL